MQGVWDRGDRSGRVKVSVIGVLVWGTLRKTLRATRDVSGVWPAPDSGAISRKKGQGGKNRKLGIKEN